MGKLVCALVLTLSTLWIAPVTARAGEARAKAGTCIEGMCQYRFANGLEVLLFPDDAKPQTYVGVTYRTGSVAEGAGETGMAHLLEHLMFKGTKAVADIPGEMKKRGIEFNAATSTDYTNYYSFFNAQSANLDWILALEADRMIHANLDQKDLDTEMTVVRNELERNANSAGAVLNERLRDMAYSWHGYGRTTIGVRSDLENMPISGLRDFYRKWYQPDNATVIIAGKFDPVATLASIERTLGAVPAPKRVMPGRYTVEPPQDGEREVTVRRPGDLPVVMLAYHIPALTHPDSPALSVLINVLANSAGGRLQTSLVDKKLAAAAGAGGGGGRDPGLLVFSAVPPKGADGKVLESSLLGYVESMAAHPITDTEVAEAKRRFANSFESMLTSPISVGSQMSSLVAAGDWRLFFYIRDQLQAVKTEDVNRVATTYLTRSNRTLARLIPTTKAEQVGIPTAPAAVSVVATYQGGKAMDAGEAFDASPANIAKRTETVVLKDHFKLALLPKKTRGGKLTLKATFRFGDVKALNRYDRMTRSMAQSLIMAGTPDMTREQIAREIEAMNAMVFVSAGNQSLTISINAKPAQLDAALALAMKLARHASYPDKEFEKAKMMMQAMVDGARNEPATLLSEAVTRHFDTWPVGHPLHHVSLDEGLKMLEKVKIADVRAYHDREMGIREGEIAVVGDFDPTEVKATLEKHLVPWNSPTPWQAIPTRHIPVASELVSIETPDRPNAFYQARLNISLKDTDSDYAAITVANEIFGGGSKSRLNTSLRETHGLSYSATSSVSADASIDNKDDAGSLTISATAAPQNMKWLAQLVQEAMNVLIKDGVTQEELDLAKLAILTARKAQRNSESSIAAMLASDLLYQRRMLERTELDEQIAALTTTEVNAAIRKHFKPADFSVYTVGDFNGASKGGAAAPAKAP